MQEIAVKNRDSTPLSTSTKLSFTQDAEAKLFAIAYIQSQDLTGKGVDDVLKLYKEAVDTFNGK